MTKRRYNKKKKALSDESDDSFTPPVAKGKMNATDPLRRESRPRAQKKAVRDNSVNSNSPVVAARVNNRVRAAHMVTPQTEYTVVKVMNKRFLNGRVEYLLEWENWPLKDCTWEPYENIECKDLILEYEKKERLKFDNPNYLVAPESSIVSFNGIRKENGFSEFAVDFVDGTTIFIPAFFAMRRYPKKFVEYMEANEHFLPV